MAETQDADEGFTQELVTSEGVTLPKHFHHRLEGLKTRHMRSDDIILCAYPKSGTHWTWEILNMIVAGNAEYAQHWKNIGVLEYHSEEELDALPSPRILSSHLAPEFLPEHIVDKGCRIIHCERNPKDAFVSFYNQHINHNRDDSSGKPAFCGSFQLYFQVYMERKGPYGHILDHVKKWRDFHTEHPNTPYLQLYYEEMKNDDVKEVKRIAEFINRPLSDEVYEQIAKACRFDNLKQASENIKDGKYYNKWKKGSSGYFRKGVTGDWKNWFTVEQSRRFDEEYERIFHKPYLYQ